MEFYHTNLEEKVRDIDFTNPTINRLVYYANLLSEQCEFIKDNGVRDLALLNSSKEIQTIDPFHNQIFL